MASPWPYTRRKSPPPRSRSPSLPSWYHRILEYSDYTVSYEDFDEDMSELGDSESEPVHSDTCGCGCIPYESGSSCGESDLEGSELDEEDESDFDHESIGSRVGCSDWESADDERDSTRDSTRSRSRSGREYDYYYELKKMREERKKQMKQEAKTGELSEKEETRQTELRIQKQVNQAYYRVRHRRGRRENLVLRRKTFALGSPDHCQYAYLGHTVQFMSKYVEFDDYPAEGSSSRPPPGQRPELRGHVFMNSTTACFFSGPAPPARPGLKEFVVRCHSGENKLTFQFIDKQHLIMKVPREVVFGCHPRKMPPNTPRILTFYGVEEK
ncbi:hypothetical protein NCS52_00928800 [Fusarium sp. LHS14.1]|nr:hypothetical protein NCS52_00928800 [Fusarium sp. LHS14.1]